MSPIIYFILKVLNIFKVPFLLRNFYSGVGSIVNLHRVVEQSNIVRISKNEKLEVSPELLEALITSLKKKGYQFVSLTELHEMMMKKSIQKKFVALTFDDGYADNYSLAFPLLKKHDIPFTIFICTSFPDKNAYLWWYMIEEFLRDKMNISFHFKDILYNKKISTHSDRIQIFVELRSIIQKTSLDEIPELLKCIFQDQYNTLMAINKELLISWDQLRELVKNPLVSIGAHTVNHLAFNKLSEEEIDSEIKNCVDKIQTELNVKVEHFSYPFGGVDSVGERDLQILKKYPFRTCVTGRIGNIFKEHADHFNALPRITISNDIEGVDKDLLTNSFDGLIPFISNFGKRIVI